MKELSKREVVNAKTAERLGFVRDLDIDYENGVIHSIIVPKRKNLVDYLKRKEYIIPWKNIVTMGEDIILVEVNEFLTDRK